METVIKKAHDTSIPVEISVDNDPELLCELVDMGIQWLSMGADVTLTLRAIREVTQKARQHGQRDRTISVSTAA